MVTVPSYSFQRFCFFKTEYMAAMAANPAVSIAPTLIVSAAAVAAGAGGGEVTRDAVAATAAALVPVLLELTAEKWAGPVAASRCLGGGGPAGYGQASQPPAISNGRWLT